MKVVTLIIFLLSACATSSTPKKLPVTLFPANEIAIDSGVIRGTLDSHGKGSGEVMLTGPDGEQYKGEYTDEDAARRKVSGVMSLHGDRGTSMQCEYTVNHQDQKGVGVCKSSSGGEYRVYF